MNSEMPSAGDALSNSMDEGVETITVHVHPTTGGQFEIEIPADETAEELKRRISRRFQTPKERLKILYKEQVLESKSLKDYKITDGSKVTLLPSVESGFSSTVQGTQQSIIQAIESLSDPQIDDFLSGRLPLTLALRVGDHMMFVQLQLEQSQVNSQNIEQRSSRNLHSSIPLNQIGHSAQNLMPHSHRLFAKMPTVPITTSQLGATTLLPEPPMDYSTKKSSPTRIVNSPIMSEPGPSPKVAKLSPKSDVTDRSDYIKSGSNTAGLLHKTHHFHHRHLPAPMPEEIPYPIFDPTFDSLQQITRYNQIATHLSHHAQSNASHLHRLVTACSSLEPVMAVPPVAEPLNMPQEHSRKSSRKRPSMLLTQNTLRQTSSQMNSYSESIEQSLPAALIQNALMRHQQLGGAFPPPPLISSAYAKYQESTRASQSSKSTQSGSIKPTSPPAVIRSKHPITSTMLQTSPTGSRSSGHSSRSEKHHKRSSTSGRVTSGSLSHHTSGMSGARVARQMQRLRRLCGSHQQCVAYSNRELATEISSIVHMARHSHHQHSRSEGSSHRKSHKGCSECHRNAASSSSTSASTSRNSTAQPGQTTGASIDSFTTHGPGIFSGTFSGSLHPSIQDPDGKPKRDPKTILQILTDLLNATHQYQGQLGNVGLLPQLFKDHFKTENDLATNKESSAASAPANNKNSEMASSSQTRNATGKAAAHTSQKSQPTKHTVHQQHVYPYMVAPTMTRSVKAPAPAQYMSSVSTIPIGTLPLAYSARPHTSSRSSRRSAQNQDGCNKHHRHHHSSRCHHHRSHGVEKQSCCGSSTCRRQAKQMLNAGYLKREHENNNTRNKMKELKKVMESQRHRRQFRRTTTKVCNKRNATESDDIKSMLTTAEPMAPVNNVVDDGDSEVKSSKMVQFDGIKDYEIKEVAHEPPETVTV